MHRSICQIKHQRDATRCRFYFCRLTLHVSGFKRPSSGVLKTARRPLVRMLWLQKGHHITILGTKLSLAAGGYRCLPCQYFILLMMGAWSPKHVEKVCSNKIYILLHHVGVLFNLNQRTSSFCCLTFPLEVLLWILYQTVIGLVKQKWNKPLALPISSRY